MMNKRLLFILLLLPLSTFAQENASVWGLPYGISRWEAIERIDREQGEHPVGMRPLTSKMSVVLYADCTIEGCNAKAIKLLFDDNKLNSTEVTFAPGENAAPKVFLHLLNVLTKQYGEPSAMNEKKAKTKFAGGRIAIWSLPYPERIYTINLVHKENNEIVVDYIELPI